MAENENVQNPEAQQPQAQPEQDDQPVFQLQRCYLKDASHEMPHAPDILLTPQESAPQVKVIILAEGRQSGIFSIHGIPAEPLQHVTNVLCPSMVYPYLRANLADLMTRAGVPPVHLPEVNFEVLYQQRLAQAQAEAHAAAEKQGDAAQN